MGKFVYRMQSILNIKQKTEGQVKMEFASAQSELNQQLDILDGYINRKEQYLLDAEKLRNEETLNLQDILDNQYATAQMDVMIASQNKVVKEYERKVERVRVKLTRAIQERKMQRKNRKNLKKTISVPALHTQKEEQEKPDNG